MKPLLSIRGPSLTTTLIKLNCTRTHSQIAAKPTFWNTYTTYHPGCTRFYATEKEPTTPKKSATPKKAKAPPKESSDAPFYELKKGEPIPTKPDQVKPVYTKKPAKEQTETKSASSQSAAPKAKKANLTLNEKGEIVIPLGSDFLRTTVRSYNGMVLVDVRKFYKDSNTGEMKPGSKGISLSVEQWNELKRQMDNIDQAIPIIPVTPKTTKSKESESQTEEQQ